MNGIGCSWSSLVVTGVFRVPFEGRANRHVENCLRCQAEAVSHRTLQQTLRTLRSSATSFDASSVDEVLRQVQPVATVHRLRRREQRGRRRALLGGVAAAATATGAGVMVWFARLSGRTSWAG